MGEADEPIALELKALEYVQSAVLEMRSLAAETDNLQMRDAFLRAANNIEKNVRELDQNSN